MGQLPPDSDGPYLFIAGEGPLQSELAALAKGRLGSRGRLLGHLEGAVLADFYAALDVFSHTPVWQEAFGLVYIEAAQ
jgi:glycosyltransferase involved in cell wall biosynthesis